jgi:hypothetical protein
MACLQVVVVDKRSAEPRPEPQNERSTNSVTLCTPPIVLHAFRRVLTTFNTKELSYG